MSFTNPFSCLICISILFSSNNIGFHQQHLPLQETPVTLYLTFDDGIMKGSGVLDSITDSCKVPINIFVIGKFVTKNDTTRQIWQQAVSSPWLEAGNHSYSHANSKFHRYYGNPLQVLEDFRRNEDSLGLKNKLARLPGRNVWRIGSRSRDDLEDSKAVADTLALCGYELIGWDLEWNYSGTDLTLEPADDLIFRIRQAIRFNRTFTAGHLVILCHDQALENPLNKAELISFIQKAGKTGRFRFSFLSRYPGVQEKISRKPA